MNIARSWTYLIRPLFAIAESVWKRVVDPMFITILLGGCVLIFLLGFSLEGAYGELKIGFIMVQIFVAFIVIFVSSVEIPRDLSTKNIQFFLSKPIGRDRYIFGKFLGILMLGEIVLGCYMVSFGFGSLLSGYWETKSYFISLSQMALQIIPLSALGIFLSVFLPELASTIFGLAFYFGAFLVFIIPSLLRIFFPETLSQLLLFFTYYPIPNWQHYLWNVAGIRISSFFFLLIVYSVSYSLFVLFLANGWFRKRDLN